MTSNSRTAAQQRADEIRMFGEELARLEREGVVALTPAQREAIAAHHRGLLAQFAQEFDIDRDARAKQLSLGMRIASFLGALALAASVFFLFRQFWDRFSTAAQVVILIGASLGTFGATLWIQGRESSGYFTKLAAMVAFACFVINIALLGQIFNITPSDKALIPWAAFALLLAYTCDLRLLLAAGILCVIAWISARTGTWSGMYWLHFGERPENFFPAAVIMFLVPQLIPHGRFTGFGPIYRGFALLTLFLPILVLSNWGRISYLDFEDNTIEGFYQVMGFALSAGAIWLGARRYWGEVVNTSSVFFVIFLYTKFFDWWWDVMPKYLFFLVLGLTAVLLLVVMRRLRAKGLFGGTANIQEPMKPQINADKRGLISGFLPPSSFILLPYFSPAAGIALIALTNAIALGGVAWNRSGEPESVLKLAQREVLAPHGFGLDREGGGLQLFVSWRVLSADSGREFYWNFQGTPEWLDEAKLASLGFDVSPPPNTRKAAWRYDRQLPREALVVLELDGPAYQRALERARARAAKEAAKGAETGKTGPGTPAQQAADFLRNEDTSNSRLFAVDAGRDAQALRAKYPDRTRYAIVQGKVRPSYQSGRGKEARWTGYIEVIENARVNVPLEFRKAVESAPRSISPARVAGGGPAFEVTVAFGKRFEPWIIAASAAAR